MGIDVEWVDKEKTILCFKYVGVWNWTEFHENVLQANQMKDSVEHTVDHIYDVTESAPLPRGAITQFYNLRKRAHPRLGRLVLVTEDRFYMALYNIMKKMYSDLGANFVIMLNLEEAIAELKGNVDSVQ